MKHYVEIVIKPDEEMRENVLLNNVYSKLHKALFELQSTDIGVSFPCYKGFCRKHRLIVGFLSHLWVDSDIIPLLFPNVHKIKS